MAYLVSVVMPTYNRAHTIAQSLDSCLAQTYDNLEIIVVDDGSQDTTADIVHGYAERDARVRLVRQANRGPAVARNTGITASQGDYIQFCDSDDVLSPEKIARSLATLHEAQSRNEHIALAYCRLRHVAEDGKTPLDLPSSPILKHENTFCELLHSNGSPIQTSTILVVKEALIKAGAYRADSQRCAEDWDMLLRLALHYEFVPHDEMLVAYRHTSDALTTFSLEMAQGRLQTFLYAGDYALRQACMSDAQYARLLAGRYHVLAMVYWRSGERVKAREALIQAMAITPDGRRARRLLWALSYILPAHQAEKLMS